MVYFRTDANAVIATGHVMRCLTIADEFIPCRQKVCFIVSDEESAILIKKRKYPYIVTKSKWDQIDIEAEYQMLYERAKYGDILIVDSYYIHSYYLSKMRAVFKVAVFDDMFSEQKDADIIINYNVFYRKFDYRERYKNKKCRLLLGQTYVPLRSQFRDLKPETKVRDSCHLHVLLMCGGGDKENMILNCLEWLAQKNQKLLNQLRWNVVIGSYYPDPRKLNAFADRFSHMEVSANVENMAEMMQKSDLCITAASTVLYECCAMQLPTIFFVVAEDQKYDAEFFEKDGMMLYCGDFKADRGNSLMRMNEYLEELVRSRERRQSMKALMGKYIDGFGAKRIVHAILETAGND